MSYCKQVSANMISISGHCMRFVFCQTDAGNSVWSVIFAIFLYNFWRVFSIRSNCVAAAAARRVCISVSLRVLPGSEYKAIKVRKQGYLWKRRPFWPGNAAFVVMASGLCASEPFRCKVIHWSIAAPEPLLLHTIQCGEIISEGTFWNGDNSNELLGDSYGCDGFRIETKL